MSGDIQAIHTFWFGTLDGSGMPLENRNSLWFKPSEDTDRRCRHDFAHLVEAAVAGELGEWQRDPSGLVALVLLLDQFTRNLYRGTAQSFAGDPRALALAQETIANGRFRRLPAIHRAFLLMPLEHAEDLEAQETCVALFSELAAENGHPQILDFLRFARAHRDVIQRFGRFPHRNAILGRESTPAELAHLAAYGGF